MRMGIEIINLILINSKFSCDIINYTDKITGRLRAFRDIKVNNKEITIIISNKHVSMGRIKTIQLYLIY